MPTFLFTAVDRHGKSVTDRVEADDLAQARYKLDLHHFTEITFYESELSNEIDNLFSKAEIEAKNKHLKNQVSLLYDTSVARHFINFFKSTAVFWIIVIGAFLFFQNIVTAVILFGCVLLTAYISMPIVLFNRLHTAHLWGKNTAARFWGGAFKWFNYISYVKNPSFEIDSYLSCVEARAGNISAAVARLMKYQGDPKISKRMFDLKLARIYGNARDFDKVLTIYESALNEKTEFTEELIDYALCLARRHKQTARAREVLEQVFERELTALAGLFIPYCQGVIEVEDGNYARAEFYLRRAVKELEPFRKNTYLVGLKCEVRAFLALALGRRGERDEAERLFEEARPYLRAVGEDELIERCEAALG